MDNVGYIALSRQMTLMRQMDVVANNIANAQSTAFKGEHMLFAEYVSRAPGGTPISYVEDVAVVRDQAQGPLTPTGGALDLAINGEGYFVVETPAGDRYTRAGAFQLDPEGAIVTAEQYPLIDDRGRTIVIPPQTTTITITPDGVVSADGERLTRLRVVTFENGYELRKTRTGLYTTDAEPEPAPEARIAQGMLEQSNVQAIVEMTRMMEILRSFQGTDNLVQDEHQRLRDMIRRLPDTQAT
ncbi:MAG: flagellar basal-body rod protein FlgF [Alphaproteobacteria bacterium]